MMLGKHFWQSCGRRKGWGVRLRKEGSVATWYPDGKGGISPLLCFAPPTELYLCNTNLTAPHSKCKILVCSHCLLTYEAFFKKFTPAYLSSINFLTPSISNYVWTDTIHFSAGPGRKGAWCRKRTSPWGWTNLCSNSGSHVFTWKRLNKTFLSLSSVSRYMRWEYRLFRELL